MEAIIKLLGNIKGGIITTIMGVLLLGFGGYLIHLSNEVTWDSVEVGIMFLGVWMLLVSDKWLTSLFKND